jgi:hypothetical protein
VSAPSLPQSRAIPLSKGDCLRTRSAPILCTVSSAETSMHTAPISGLGVTQPWIHARGRAVRAEGPAKELLKVGSTLEFGSANSQGTHPLGEYPLIALIRFFGESSP